VEFCECKTPEVIAAKRQLLNPHDRHNHGPKLESAKRISDKPVHGPKPKSAKRISDKPVHGSKLESAKRVCDLPRPQIPADFELISFGWKHYIPKLCIIFCIRGGTKNENGSDTTKPIAQPESHAGTKTPLNPTLMAAIANDIHSDIMTAMQIPKNKI
jgi:hypothetical protein